MWNLREPSFNLRLKLYWLDNSTTAALWCCCCGGAVGLRSCRGFPLLDVGVVAGDSRGDAVSGPSQPVSSHIKLQSESWVIHFQEKSHCCTLKTIIKFWLPYTYILLHKSYLHLFKYFALLYISTYNMYNVMMFFCSFPISSPPSLICVDITDISIHKYQCYQCIHLVWQRFIELNGKQQALPCT